MNYYDDNGLVLCKLCDKAFHFITPRHLKKYHDISTKDYREMYPDAPMAKMGYYDTLKNKKIKRKTEPIIEELDDDESFLDFKESESIIKLADHKIPVPVKSTDPMNDKIAIVAYLKLSFPKIKDNYMFKKKRPDGTIEYQFITDISDPSCKIIFDFPNAFWHNEQVGVSSYARNRILKSLGWRIIEINESMPKVKHVENKINC